MDRVPKTSWRIRLRAKTTGFSKENTGQLTEVTRSKNKESEEFEETVDSSMHNDIALCATGWKCSLSFLSTDIQEQLFNEYGQAQIYRGVYCPCVPQMAFLGLHINLNSMLDSALGARWIDDLAKGSAGCLLPTLTDEERLLSSMEAGLAFERRPYDPTRHFQKKAPGFFTTGWSPVVYSG
jgi:hypothetical protein